MGAVNLLGSTAVVEIAVQFPGVTEAVSYGEPSLKVRTSLLTRWRMNDDSIVLLDVDSFERIT